MEQSEIDERLKAELTRVQRGAIECSIPSHMQHSLTQYVVYGHPIGDFLGSILSNDFVHAAGYADDMNQHALYNYARFIHCYVPTQAWGSKDATSAWQLQDGMRALYKPANEGKSNDAED